MRPEKLWLLSCLLYQKKCERLAKVLKSINFLVFHSVLPYECRVSRDVELWHRGLGTVIHPNTTIGHKVKIGHNVTIAAGNQDRDSVDRVYVGDGVVIGTGAFLAARQGSRLVVGEGATIGAHAVVTGDVPPGAKMRGPKALEY